MLKVFTETATSSVAAHTSTTPCSCSHSTGVSRDTAEGEVELRDEERSETRDSCTTMNSNTRQRRISADSY